MTSAAYRSHRAKTRKIGIEKRKRYIQASVYDMRVIDMRARHIKGYIDAGIVIVKWEEKRLSTFVKNKIKSLFNLMLDYTLEYEIVEGNYSRNFNLSDKTIKEILTVKKGRINFTKDEIRLL